MTIYRRALAWLEWVANPALAGAAVLLLCLGVVTWLPALAAAATALRAWRYEGDSRCFAGTLAAFPAAFAALWRHAIASTAAIAVLLSNVLFLVNREQPIGLVLLSAQVGILVALIPYHLALAVTRAPGAALALAFGSWQRGLLLLAAALLTPLLTLPLALGPLLFGPTLPLLVALAMERKSVPL